eukprot:3645692-Prymnesium_polylepis.3
MESRLGTHTLESSSTCTSHESSSALANLCKFAARACASAGRKRRCAQQEHVSRVQLATQLHNSAGGFELGWIHRGWRVGCAHLMHPRPDAMRIAIE